MLASRRFNWMVPLLVAASLALALLPSPLRAADTTGGVAGFKVMNARDAETGGFLLSALVAGDDDALYGVAAVGGAQGAGTLFRMTRGGRFTVLHEFDGAEGGAQPNGLVKDRHGDFFGVTQNGGAHGLGVVYRFTRHGEFSVLHAFAEEDGYRSLAPLTQADDGRMFGTTFQGGPGGSSAGTVFAITPQGEFQLRHAFSDDGVDGSAPAQGLRQASDGSLYGTTTAGGRHASGVAFRLRPNGAERILHAFRLREGASPSSGLIEGPDGSFYGTTRGGPDRPGSIYRMSPQGETHLVFTFRHARSEGAAPYGDLLLARDGNFYGVTASGGRYGAGTAYRLTPDGTHTVLHHFDGINDGYSPGSALVEVGDGEFYGTAPEGGPLQGGTIYRITLK